LIIISLERADKHPLHIIVNQCLNLFQNATLPARGEFYPYKDNPLAVARFDHSKEMLAGQRREMQEILEDHLEKRGVDLVRDVYPYPVGKIAEKSSL